MAKGLARQYAGRKIRTNVVSPGMVYFKGGVWNMVETNSPDFFKQAGAQPHREGRHAPGNRQCDGFPGQPRFVLYDRR